MAIPSHGQTCPRPSTLKAGFTLIEVLITLVILSTGIVVVLEAFQTSAMALGAARDSLLASHLLNITIDAVERDGLSAAQSVNSFSPPFDHFQRLITSQGASVETPGVNHLRAEVWRNGSSVVYARDIYQVAP